MSTIRPFKGIRPAADLAASIAALPYDVYSSSEARTIVRANPLSFLKIDRAETLMPENTDIYSPEVYQTARRTLDAMITDGSFIQDNTECYYIYALTMDGRTQTGLAGCAAIDDYLNGVILKHENTLAAKEEDRVHHVDACSAQTGPIFLAYRPCTALRQIINNIKNNPALYDFTSDDGVRHQNISIKFLNYSRRFRIFILLTDTTELLLLSESDRCAEPQIRTIPAQRNTTTFSRSSFPLMN